MNPRLPLLLNLAVLVVTLVLVVAHSDSQERVLRATTRMACEAPAPWRPYCDSLRGDSLRGDSLRDPEASEGGASGRNTRGASGGAIGQVSHIRLLKYLARVDGLEDLSAPQLEAVYLALEDCCRVLVEAGTGVRKAPTGGAGARRSAEAARDKAEREVTQRLRDAAIPEGQLLARLVRVVVSSAG